MFTQALTPLLTHPATDNHSLGQQQARCARDEASSWTKDAEARFYRYHVTCDKGMPKEILFIDENRNLFINAEN
jgi:hypothetical protein